MGQVLSLPPCVTSEAELIVRSMYWETVEERDSEEMDSPLLPAGMDGTSTVGTWRPVSFPRSVQVFIE